MNSYYNPKPAFYRISIEASGLTGTSALDAGFIDNVLLSEYVLNGNYPSSYAQSLEKVRANNRFDFLLEELSETNCIQYVLNVNNSGATVDSPGSSLNLTVVYPSDSSIYTYNELFGWTGHPTQNLKLLEGESAVRRQCARVWIKNRKTQKRMPINVSGMGWEDVDVVVNGPLVNLPTLSQRIDAAEGKIVVVRVSGTF